MKEKILSEIKISARENWIPVLLDDTANFIEIILQALRPRDILEIGTAIGYSAAIFARAVDQDVHIDTIELDSERVQLAWKNINDLDLSHCIRIIEGDASEILQFLTKQYDFIFLDAAKSKYIDFLPHCERLLRKDGILIADNVLYKGMTQGTEEVRHKQRTAVNNLREFLDTLINHKGFQTQLIDIGDGITMSVKV